MKGANMPGRHELRKHEAGPDPAALLREHMEGRPYQTLAVAAGVGFVLGGGLWNHLVRSLVNVGARLAITAAATTLLDGLGRSGVRPPEPSSPSNRSSGGLQ